MDYPTPHQKRFLEHVRDNPGSPYEVQPATIYMACIERGWVEMKATPARAGGKLRDALWQLTDSGRDALAITQMYDAMIAERDADD